jgi:DNA-binding GntR family transcriptional regulator
MTNEKEGQVSVAAFRLQALYEAMPQHSSRSYEGPLAEQVYEHILTTLVFPPEGGEVQVGSKITESELADKLQISNGPVREALFRLRQEGWIRTRPNRGSYLVDFSDRKIAAEIFRFRLSVETGAFYSLAEAITDAQLGELKNVVDALNEASGRAAIADFRKADIEFHLKVVEFAGGQALKAVYRPKLLQWYAMAYHVLKQTLGNENWKRHLEVPATSHSRLYGCLAQHNPAEAAQVISRHFDYIAHILEIGRASTNR